MWCRYVYAQCIRVWHAKCWSVDERLAFSFPAIGTAGRLLDGCWPHYELVPFTVAEQS